MKRTMLLLACLLLCAAAAGTWAVVHRERSAAPASAAQKSADTLAALPAASGNSLADKAIALWTAKAREGASNDKAWTGLGDSLMQKARETADAAYYGHAERAYEK